MNIPSREDCLKLLASNKTPFNIICHTKKVAKFAESICDSLIGKGMPVNKDLVIAGALLHDIEKMKDDHANRGADLVTREGFPEVGDLIRFHGYFEINKQGKLDDLSIEQKILFYADKRVRHDNIVSLEERYADLKKRYGHNFDEEIKFTKKIESELMIK